MLMISNCMSFYHLTPKNWWILLNLGLQVIMGGMMANKLRLNPDKTEVLLVGHVSDPSTGITPMLVGAACPLKAQVHSFWVLLEPKLLLDSQVAAVATSASYQLRLICPLWLFPQKKDLTIIIHIFVTSGLIIVILSK